MKDLLIVVLIIIGIFVFIGLGGSIGYKEGQIDAIRGDIRYELVEQSDGSTDWKKIKK